MSEVDSVSTVGVCGVLLLYMVLSVKILSSLCTVSSSHKKRTLQKLEPIPKKLCGGTEGVSQLSAVFPFETLHSS